MSQRANNEYPTTTPIAASRMIVVGANGEIGSSVVKLAQSRGYSVIGLDIAATPPMGLTSDQYLALDIRDAGNITTRINEAVEKLEGVDCLINAAGILLDRTLWQTSDEELMDILSINLAGSFHLTRAVTEHMRRAHSGSIVLMSSIHGSLGAKNRAAYAATKGGIEAFVRASAVELGPHAIRINAVAPGPVGNGMGNRSKERDRFEQSTPLRNQNLPQDIAAGALFLASNDARRITGHILPVDGGATSAFLSNNNNQAET